MQQAVHTAQAVAAAADTQMGCSCSPPARMGLLVWTQQGLSQLARKELAQGHSELD